MARATIRIDYDGGGHIEIAEESFAGISIADLTTQAVLLAQGAYEKLIKAAGMELRQDPPPEQPAAGSVDTVPQSNGKANEQAARAAAGKKE